MSILVTRDTRVICQGITGKVGEFHTRGCLDYGTRMVGGVTPGKGGETVADLPVFNTVAEAVAKTGADATMIFVPAAGAADLGRRILADVEHHAAGQIRSDDICLDCVGRSSDLSGPAHPAQKPGSARRGVRMQAGG